MRRSGALALLLAALSVAGSCGGESQPDPPDTAAVDGDCPSGLPSDAACASEVPSYELTVAPIIERRCGACHYRGNTLSGDEFVDYDDVWRARRTLLTRVYTCAMPPDGAAALAPEERRALLQWFVCGAPEN